MGVYGPDDPFMGIIGCAAVIIIALVMVIVGMAIHWPDNYVAACALVAAFLLGYTLRGGQ